MSRTITNKGCTEEVQQRKVSEGHAKDEKKENISNKNFEEILDSLWG
jgi:hypothetical protein